jgi:transposase
MFKSQSYSREFKIEAVRLLEQADKPAAEIALSLGVRRNQIYKWQEELRRKGETAFAGRGPGRPPSDQAAENARLRRENEQLREERDILKKAAAYFARDVR